jgi:hypothetical protein
LSQEAAAADIPDEKKQEVEKVLKEATKAIQEEQKDTLTGVGQG